MYVTSDREATLNNAIRAVRSGFKALVLTVDTPVVGYRRFQKKWPFICPAHLSIPMVQAV